MNILAINQDWFVDEWQAAGHRVLTCGHLPKFDLQLQVLPTHLDSVLRRCPSDFVPDVIVFFDNSLPHAVVGFEQYDIPLLFYSVDVHHHAYWHKYFATVADHTFIAQKDYLDEMRSLGGSVDWMPLWASRHIEPSNEKEHGAVFVGTLDRNLNPERVDFFDSLCSKVDFLCTRGEFWTIFPFSEIIVNQTVKGDLNFRVFEGMMSGAMMLTEQSGNGLHDLFAEKEHLVTYEKNNVEQVADIIKYYMSNLNECRAIGHAGREEILARHTIEKRAYELLPFVENLKKTHSDFPCHASMVGYVTSAIRYQRVNMANAIKCLTEAMKTLEQGMKLGEPIPAEATLYAVLGCYEYDRLIQSGSGHKLLEQLNEAYTDVPVFKFAELRNYLNRGEKDKASIIAAELAMQQDEAFAESEKVMRLILNMKGDTSPLTSADAG